MAGEVAQRAIEIANTYLYKLESKIKRNWAPWLDQLMTASGNPAKWRSPDPYCIAALCSVFAIACKELGVAFPIKCTASTQTFYDNAAKAKLVSQVPEVGDIVIFRVGKEWHGHAELIVGISPEGLSTIGFNTSGTVAGSQRNGDGVYLKLRRFKDFTNPTKLHIRGYVKTSTI